MEKGREDFSCFTPPRSRAAGYREGAPQGASALHREGEREKHSKPRHSAASVASLQRTLQLSPTLHPAGRAAQGPVAAPPPWGWADPGLSTLQRLSRVPESVAGERPLFSGGSVSRRVRRAKEGRECPPARARAPPCARQIQT